MSDQYHTIFYLIFHSHGPFGLKFSTLTPKPKYNIGTLFEELRRARNNLALSVAMFFCDIFDEFDEVGT